MDEIIHVKCLAGDVYGHREQCTVLLADTSITRVQHCTANSFAHRSSILLTEGTCGF